MALTVCAPIVVATPPVTVFDMVRSCIHTSLVPAEIVMRVFWVVVATIEVALLAPLISRLFETVIATVSFVVVSAAISIISPGEAAVTAAASVA